MATATTEAPPLWRARFKTPAEMQERSGSAPLIIGGFLPPGVTLFGGAPGDGKSWTTLFIAKAVYLGEPFLEHFPVTQKAPIVYLTPEVNESSFKQRLRKIGLGNVHDGFYVQTLSDGPATPLNDKNIIAAVKELKPLVFLDTAARFNPAGDENSAMETAQGLAKYVFGLLQFGAIGVVANHHATKGSTENEPTLDNTLRGSSDLAAMADAVYRVTCTDHQNFVTTITNVKARDFDPPGNFEFRGRPGIDEEGKLHLLRPPEMEPEELAELQAKQVGDYISAHPSASQKEIGKACTVRKAKIPALAQAAGWNHDRKKKVWGKSK